MENWNKRTYILTIIVTILGLVGMMILNHYTFYMNIMSKMQNMGVGNLSVISQAVESSLSQNLDLVQATAITMEYMMENRATKEELEDFLIYESNKYTNEIDNSFSGIYGVFNGEYIDGLGWIPDETYIPSSRSWYTAAQAANGTPTLVSPYLDARTNTIMLSISQMLSDKESVISLDINTDNIQNIVTTNSMNELGYIFIVEEGGLVISHSDINERGQNYLFNERMGNLIKSVVASESAYFETELDNEDYWVFSNKIMNNWYVVIVLDEDIFFKDVNATLFKNILLYGIISALILFFFIYTFKQIRHSMEMERTSNQKLDDANMKMIRALVRTIDAKDRYTNGHSLRVADYAAKIAEKMGKSPEEQKQIYYAGLLHDVGKIRVPEDIINKPGKLTSEEFEQIKIHPVTGYHILKDIYEDKSMALAAKFHHERYDGNGYPSGLSGENIPEIARIIGVADTYDAMASNRSYRRALPQEKVREEIVKGMGTQFDPAVASIVLQMIDNDPEYKLKENTDLIKTVLVVDDDPINIKVTKLIMEKEPYCEIVSATSGKEALELLDRISVDLILLDVEMSDMNGFETLARIRQKHNTPVVFLTGNKDIHTIQEANKLGVDDYISKPFIPLTLKETIHSILHT